MIFISNAFNDPNNPWYYVIGVLFLLLIFGALALYIYLSGKKKPADGKPPEDGNISETEVTEDATEAEPAVASESSVADETSENE